MSSDQENIKQFSNWNQGFFKNQESMGEFEREVLNDPPLTQQNNNAEAEWNQNKNLRHDILHDIDESDLEADLEETGWNLGFFAGQEVMSDEERKFWTQDVKVNNEDLIDKDLLSDINNSDYDNINSSQDNEYSNAINNMNNRSSSLRDSLIFGDESINEVNNKKKKKEYIDDDNYDKFLNVKQKKDWINIYFEILFQSVYTFILIGFVLWDLGIYFGYFDNSNSRPNWGLMLVPIIIITIFKSLNSYSMIKILF